VKAGRSKPSGPVQAKAGAKTAPTWVKILVGFHVFATVVWALPNLTPEVMSGRVAPTGTKWLLYWNAKYLKNLDPVKGYLMTTGAWQYWDMFAPDPSNKDWYCTAEVEYRDGTKRTIPYPRMADLPVAEKYLKERYRKYYERAHGDTEPIDWPVFAQRMALLGYTDPNNPPHIVRLYSHGLPTAAPGLKQDTEYSNDLYYSYVVDLKELRAAAGGK
jgi:hypothetical protein